MSRFENLKVGDVVFVVWQRTANAIRADEPYRVFSTPVVKVGRLFAYISNRFGEHPFDKKTGISHHGPNDNSRYNGHGFDVYPDRAAWQRAQHEQAECARLKQRLGIVGRSMVEGWDPQIIARVHAALDATTVATDVTDHNALDDKYAKLIKAEAATSDAEYNHSKADTLLCELLKELGCRKTVRAWSKVSKWYG